MTDRAVYLIMFSICALVASMIIINRVRQRCKGIPIDSILIFLAMYAFIAFAIMAIIGAWSL